MAPHFKKMSRGEFAHAVATHSWQPAKTEIHFHHTWRPNHSQYNGVHSINGMYKFHTETNGWSDIAQHVSIAPDGAIWTGRPWNRTPASAGGHNHPGVFMFETIGDFDTGKDPLIGEQMESVLFVVATLQIWFGLPLWSSIRFHNQMSTKSCPGTSIDRTRFISQIKAKRKELEDFQEEMFAGSSGPLGETLMSAIGESGPQAETAGRDEGELEHGPALEVFMNEHHANPFVSGEGLAAESSNRGIDEIVKTVRALTEGIQAEGAGDPDEALFAELGIRAQSLQAFPERSGDLSSAPGPVAEGLRESFSELGRRIFARLEREFHALLCGDRASDAADRAKLRDAFGLGADAVTAAIVGVLTGGLGLAPAIAAVVAALLVRRVLQPTYQETCVYWSTRFE